MFSKILFFGLIGFCLMQAPGRAETYYVSNAGADGRTAQVATDRNRPWRSIQRALNMVRAGDRIVVLDGIYYEQLSVTTSGLAGREIELRSENREGAKIIGSIVGGDVSFFRIDGFDISNRRTDAIQSKGIAFYRCHHLTIRNNRVHECRGGGISLDQSDWLLVEWNIVHQNAFFNIEQHSGISIYQPQYRGNDTRAHGIVIRNNTCFANQNLLDNPAWGRPTDGNGIVVDDFFNESEGGNGVVYNRITIIENNLCYLNGGQGIHCYQSNNIQIRSNTCYKNLISFDFGGEISVVASNRVFVFNNVLFARSGRNVALQFESSQVWWDYNLLHNGPVFQASNGPNTIYANPFFVSNSFQLQPGSLAMDSGLTSTSVFPLDVNGGLRIVGGAIDRGAIEFNPADN